MTVARVSRAQGRSFYLGLVILVLAGVVTYVSLTADQGLPGSARTEVKAAFDDVGSLTAGADVRRNSVRIGRVASVDLVGGRPQVTMELDGHQPVYRNARAAIWDQSALSQKFVELLPGDATAPPLGDGVIPAAATEGSADIARLFDVLDQPTRDAATSAVRQLGTGMAGHSQDLHDLLGSLPGILGDTGAVASAIASREADLPALLASTDRLAGRFEGRQKDLESLVVQLDQTLQAVHVDDGKPLADTLKAAPDLLRHGTAAAAALTQPLADARAAVTDLRTGAKSLGDATPDLRGVLQEAPAQLQKIPGFANQATPAVDSLTQTFADLRPLAARLGDGLPALTSLLQTLAPYAPEIGDFAYHGGLVFAGHAGDRHYMRVELVLPGLAGATAGVTPLNAMTPVARNPYPAPGQDTQDRAQGPGLLGGRN
ncbi:MlaD family protein [Amycolatopsis benzoatilytica]|uniref:MlaD family protein n=1 Tax=Amycolatopsis benzoatilytica TaxID=346045 RepID=UPI00035FED68|nr:MlaD family protein [Amycolatopsis benzoatilytica]